MNVPVLCLMKSAQTASVFSTMANAIMPGINKVPILKVGINTDAPNNIDAIKPWTVTSYSAAKEIYATRVRKKSGLLQAYVFNYNKSFSDFPTQ